MVIEHTARALVTAGAAAMGFQGSLGVFAQAVPGVNDAFLMQLAEKGGGWVVLLIVLFFYRRDYQKLTTSENEVRRELLEAIQKQAESEKQLALAISENTQVVRMALVDRDV